MKKFFLLILLAIFTVSCSKKVDVKGKIAGGSPMERIEFIDASGVATLPLTNLSVSPNGEFSGSFTVPKSGMYVLSYGGKIGFLYLKGGENLNISGNQVNFPEEMVITGDAKKNNDFIKENQKFFQQYAAKINVGQEIAKDEAAFLQSAKKIHTDLDNHIEESAKKIGADSGVKQWKKDDLAVNILAYLSQYENNHAVATQNPTFKASKNFKDFQKTLEADSDRKVQSSPNYRTYLLNKLTPDFQKFAMASPANQKLSTVEILANFFKTKKDMLQITKDYLLGFVGSQEMKIGDYAAAEKVAKVAETEISNAEIKKDLKNLTFIIGGFKEGTPIPDAALIKQDGSKSNLTDFKGKPTLVMLYASWNPYIAQSVTPVLKEVTNFYKSKMNFAYINVDDTKEQFIKTSNAMLKGFPGTNYFAEGGLNSDLAKKLGIYGFKLPGFIILDKDGKTVGKYFNNLGDQEFVAAMDKVSGLKAPTVDPNVQLKVGADALNQQQNAAPQQQPSGNDQKVPAAAGR